jgi:CubicO group peptidase (beta-lactamase class C family)
VQLFTSAQRVGLYDQTFKHVIDWGFGFITNTQPDDPARPYGFGPHASPKTFGHGGSQSSVGFADPAHDLTVAIIFNGVPGEPRHQTRIRETLAAVYEDLCLAQN